MALPVQRRSHYNHLTRGATVALASAETQFVSVSIKSGPATCQAVTLHQALFRQPLANC